MKNLLYFLICIPAFCDAQPLCTGIENREIFQANRIGASIYPHGYKFYDEFGFYKVPYTSDSSPSTIFAANAWIGAYKFGQLSIAAQTFASEFEYEYQVGPLLENSTSLDSACLHYNRIWSVKRTDILKHKDDFESDGIIDDTLANIFGWPAEGNSYFKSFNSFSLPLSHQGGWAEFYDANQNGSYEPEKGEYPCIYLNGELYYPEVMMWMVYNDQGYHTSTQGEPVGVEIQLTVYGFNCEDNPVLNNALFNSYKVINQQNLVLDSVYFGMWADYDLGCPNDDFIGCDTARHTEFVYNADGIDGDSDADCSSGAPTYADLAPIQSFTYLSHPMYSFSNGRIHDSISAEGYYNALAGRWPDGTPITVFDNGYNPGGGYPETKFLYSGDPRDPGQWSLVSIDANPEDFRTISSISLGQLAPFETVRIDGAYVFHQNSGFEHLELLSFMQEQLDALISGYANGDFACTPYQDCQEIDCVWPGDFNHNGKADHFDLLTWGVAKDQQGSTRNGLFNWDGYHADPWTLNMPGGLNAKYTDGNGDGLVHLNDLERNLQHFTSVNPLYQHQDKYPVGPHLVLTANPINENGAIRGLSVLAAQDIPGVLGLAYEIDFDTSLFTLERLLSFFPSDSNYLGLTNRAYEQVSTGNQFSASYAFVQTDHQPVLIEDGFRLQRDFPGYGIKLRPELSADDIPDSTIIRIKNLIAIDPNGNDLNIGSEPLIVYKEGIVGINEFPKGTTQVFPNPANGSIQILTDRETEAEMYTLDGRFIRHLTQLEVSRPIQVSDLATGVYVLKILSTGEAIKVVLQ